MPRKYVIQMKYLTYIGGKPYYQRRYPLALRRARVVNSANHKVALKSDPSDTASIAAEIATIDSNFSTYLKSLTNQNHSVLNQVELEHRAHIHLEHYGLSAGEGVQVGDKDVFDLYLDNLGIFKDAEDVEKEAFYYRRTPIYPENALVQKVAKELLFKPDFRGKSYTFKDVEIHWINKKGLSTNHKTHRREMRVWENFLEINDNTVLSEESIEEYLFNFVQARQKDIKNSSLVRQLTTICSALNDFIKDHRLKIRYDRPQLKIDKKDTKRAPSLYYENQKALLSLLDSTAPWKKLYVLIAFHSGGHPSELKQLRREHFKFDSQIPHLIISGDSVETRKDTARERVIPIVLQKDEIKHLVESGALDTLTSKTTDNIEQQISRLIKKIQPSASPYSLRHTLAHNVEAAGLEASSKSALGGWSGVSLGLSEHMVNYGQDGKDVLERLAPLKERATKVLQHLIEASK